MKIKAETLAKSYDLSRKTIFNYKKGSDGKKRLYNAMVENYFKNNKDK
tara:strand:+ start:980 stop:1123 length:144 start_codon:yes stop_codon:yes gene_type:complete